MPMRSELIFVRIYTMLDPLSHMGLLTLLTSLDMQPGINGGHLLVINLLVC